jgi:hypothetical protein
LLYILRKLSRNLSFLRRQAQFSSLRLPLVTAMLGLGPLALIDYSDRFMSSASGRVADFHVVICQVKARVSRARSGERANQQFQDVLGATVCLSASVPALGRTRQGRTWCRRADVRRCRGIWTRTLARSING